MSERELSRFEILPRERDRRMTQQQAGQVLGLPADRYTGCSRASSNTARPALIARPATSDLLMVYDKKLKLRLDGIEVHYPNLRGFAKPIHEFAVTL
jgi:hypothetical protein